MDVASYRTKLGLTQAEFAEAMGVSPGHVGDLERKPPRRRLTVKLAARLEDLTKEGGIVDQVVAEQTGRAA